MCNCRQNMPSNSSWTKPSLKPSAEEIVLLSSFLLPRRSQQCSWNQIRMQRTVCHQRIMMRTEQLGRRRKPARDERVSREQSHREKKSSKKKLVYYLLVITIMGLHDMVWIIVIRLSQWKASNALYIILYKDVVISQCSALSECQCCESNYVMKNSVHCTYSLVLRSWENSHFCSTVTEWMKANCKYFCLS